MVHHGARERQRIGENAAWGARLPKVLSGLWIARTNVEAQRGSSVAHVSSCDHGVKEGGVVVHSNVLDLQHVNVGTGLLIQEVLLHGFVHFLSGHFILEIASDGFVHFVHVGGDVLACQNGGCTKDAHRLSSVVLCIGRVAPGSRVQTVVDGKVPDFMVSADGFTGCALIVLDLVQSLKADEVVVQVVDACGWVGVKRLGQQLDRHGQACVLSVNRC